MKKILFLTIFYCGCLYTSAQQPEDALRNAWFIPGGTARSAAIGGATTGLGGDISANNSNPAGIGLYKTREFLFSPGWNFNDNRFNYRDSIAQNNSNAFRFGTIGFVAGFGGDHTITSQAISVSFSRLASYNDHTYFKGFNNQSSFSEQYLEELTADKADYQSALYNYVYGSSLAFNTYLIDTFQNADGSIGGYRSLVPLAGPQHPYDGVLQERWETTKGGYHELSVAYAANFNEKLFLGGSINLPIVSYRRSLSYSEKDVSGNTGNNFAFFDYRQEFKSSGVGVNGKLGIIYRPKSRWRLGFSIHTPSIISFKDEITYAEMTTDTENFKGLKKMSSDDFDKVAGAGIAEYRQVTPWRAMAGLSYVFNEVKDTRRQRAFITADIEYVHYKGARFLIHNTEEGAANKEYYNALNDAIKNYYRGNFNVKLGGEIKFDPVAVRLGVAHYGSPYRDKELKASRTSLSGGIGLRKFGYFLDLTYVHTLVNDVVFPYRLNNVANTFAEQGGSQSALLLTLGFKF